MRSDPLNAVIGMTGTFEYGIEARAAGFVQTIRHSSNALLTIINDILDFSRSGQAGAGTATF